ncbi:MAG: transferrin receptor-like dimerization domain-containing protein [Steroidobacteraceae bacterium]|jgi:N-acetylated-alpha-linked acidic dipeptidase
MANRIKLAMACAFLAAAQAAPAADADPGSILGFTPRDALREREIESQFQSLPSPEKAREWHRIFTSQPHPAASRQNTRLANVIAREWRRQGWEDVTLRHYDVLHSSPRSVSLEMTAPIAYRATLREQAYERDPDTKNPRIDSAYFGYSASGDIRAELVYAHSGNPEDYEILRQHGVSVKGKVVIVRYSNPYSYRGFKALTAEREGAAAILIYSDPAEDGYARGKVFPDGPFGPDSHIQHGAITYDYIVPGDPTTPGWASVPGARHIAPADAKSLPKIVGLPLSWRDAKPLLEHMSGEEVPPEWRGALPITYRFGGGVIVHLHVDMDTRMRRYTVVEARIRGGDLPDEWVLVGNHRDAWVYGGVDPVSGTASMLELTRSLGELKRRGIRPRRTLIACSWDGEEYALTGSTEWGEQFADELKKKLVAYINVDEAVAGAAATAGPEGLSFAPSAVASLAPMLIESAKSVLAPSGKPLDEAWRATTMRDRHAASAVSDADLVETRIGSGSDHTVFLNHLGRPVINLGFEGDYGVYHSAYDDHFWMTHLGDPQFAYHVALTRIWGVVALRLANAGILPFDFAANGAALRGFLADLERRTVASPSRLLLAPLATRIAAFERAGQALHELTLGHPDGADANDGRVKTLNEQLLQVESNWLDPQGIPGRPWFQHLLYAARYTYAHLEFPGLTEAIEAGNRQEAGRQAAAIEGALEKNTRLLQSAADPWRPTPRYP